MVSLASYNMWGRTYIIENDMMDYIAHFARQIVNLVYFIFMSCEVPDF